MGKGGGGGGQTTSTSYQTNIPEYARPYVDTMLGATQKQLFNTRTTEATPAQYDSEGNQTSAATLGGETEITGFKPYQAYGGTYDDQGNQLSYDPGKAIAGFQPMQTNAQQGIAGLRMPGEFGQASGITQAAAQNAQNMGYQNGRFSMQQIQDPNLQNYQMGPAERVSSQNFGGQSAQDYMSPYMQNVVDVQQREAQRQADIAGTGRGAQAVKSGAFGGSRQAVMDAEAARNLATQKGDIQAQGLQASYGQAQQQFNADQARQMAAQQANQGAGLTVGQQNLGANLGIQQLGAGQNMQAQLANQQAFQTAQQAAEQSRQYGAGYRQNANAQALTAANQLAGIGQQGLTAQQGIYGLQNQVGAQQQAIEQQKINQAMTDYANAQQYPLMQLGTMSNMLRGLPMQAQTTSQYQAAPNALTQGIGAVGAYGALNNAGMFGAPKTSAEGGVIKGYAAGGIMSYDVGGAVEADLEDMDVDGLKRQVKESSSPRIKQMAQRILTEKQMPARRMAGGGIIAFKAPTEENNYSLVDGKSEYTDRIAAAGRGKEEIEKATARALTEDNSGAPPVAAPVAPPVSKTNPAGGILGNATSGVLPNAAPTPTPIDAFADVKKNQATQQETANKSIEDIMAERQAIRDKLGVGTNAPQEAYRAEQMAERANLKDEAERRKNLRLAEFFASWGSTPGSTLAAGMSALKKSIPGIVEDDKEAKKLKRESDKIIYDIDQATRLEKLGRVDEATAIKEKAATHAQELNKQILTAQTQMYGYDSSRASSKYTADRSLEGTLAHVKAIQSQTAATKAGNLDTKAFGQVQTAEANYRRTLEAIEREKQKGPYAEAVSTVATYSGADVTEGSAGAKRLQAAKDVVDKMDKEHKERIDTAKTSVDTASNRYLEIKGAPPAGTSPDAPGKDTRPDWVPAGAKKAPDGNYYIEKGGKFVKVLPND
jgi:hypothetical protein